MDKMSALSAKSANDIKRSLERIGAAGIAMGAALVTGTAALIESSVATIGSMSRLAQSAGTTAEKFSVLAYAAKLNHTPMEDLAKGLEKLSQSAFKAQNGNAQLGRIFDKLGVATKDSTGHLRDSSDMLNDVAVKFSQMGTAAGKPALAMALFGKAGAQLIPLLNDLGKHQAEITEEAKKYGLVIGNDVPAKVRAYHEVLVKLHAAQEGFGMQLTVAVLPALTALSERLQELGSRFDIAKLAEAFGAKVTVAINGMVRAFDFATTHVGLLKAALVALAGIQVAKIAIPIIGDLAGGGINKLGEGITKMLLGFAGLGKVVPQLMKFGAWIAAATTKVLALASAEGVAAAATYVLDGALAVVSAPAVAITGAVVGAIAAIVGLGVAIYKFRDATFSLGGTTYKLRDTWNAAWIGMGWGLTWIKDHFSTLATDLKSIWGGLTKWLSENPIGKFLGDDLSGANERLEGYVGKFVEKAIERLKDANSRLAGHLTPEIAIKALNEAKGQRETSRFLKLSATDITPPSEKKGDEKPPPDTSGLGKEKESPVGKLLANLQEKLDESKQTLAAAGLEEEAQRKVAAANKASNEIMKLGEEIAKQTGARTKDYASLVDGATQAIIREKNAQISDIEAKTTLLNLLGTTSRASALSIAQSGLMVQAMDKGSDAVMRQAAVTQAWNELRAKGGSLTEILARSQEIYAEAVAKESQAIHGNIINLQNELAMRRIVNAAILDSADAQDEAALKAQLYALQLQIDTAAAGELRDSLLKQKQAITDLFEANKQMKDLENARKYDPAKEYQDQEKSISDAEKALYLFQGNMLTYGQTLQIAMAHQENFNRLIDATVKGLLSENNAANGVKAFFFDMQKSAITAAQAIYDALHSAFTKLSENLTQLVTGGKTSFAQMFQDIGRQMVNQSIQSAMQKGLGALGKTFPSLSGPLGNLNKAIAGKPDGSDASRALWVRMASASGSTLPNFGGAGGIGGKGGLGGVGGSALGVGTGVMGTGVTSLGGGGDALGLGGSHGIPGIPNIAGLGVGALGVDILGDAPGDGEGGDTSGRRILPMPEGFVGENTNNYGRRLGGLLPTQYSNDPTDLLGGWSPGDGEGGGALGGGLGDAITGIGPDQNDSEGGGGGVGGAVAGIGGGLLSMIGGIFGGGNKGKPDGSKGSPLFVQMAGGGSGGSGGVGVDALGDGGSTDQTGNGGGSGGAGLSAITGMIGSLVNLFSGSNKNSTASKTFTFLGSMVSSFSGLIPHADGGPISGPGTGTSDSIPARLSNGEFVVRATPAAKYKGLLQHINKGGNVHKTPGFAAGGFVGYANGGTVTAPSTAYTMGETTSSMATASGQIAGTTAARRGQGSTGPNLYYTIDARGTDPVLTEQRTRTAIMAAHNSAISNAVQVSAERVKRTPQR
jgi:hypothetical protein